ncbi:MAG: saccharopine dehydrogenase NADP-binding domain-containing protein [Proteobacteria bacterium]|nr:saccharopine dehydrogenase NADP-binding domain-containing protein [Pseudomonadota bacterium]MDA0967355.1 saccharopine dehydrogenase NADP-binding domain-containing protein [Pseudomonadota bacterium]
MITRVLIIGGYGNFGSFIAKMLAREDNIQLIIAGRNEDKAQSFAKGLEAKHKAETAIVDINHILSESLSTIKPHVVIHTSGPYQNQSYHVAEACIAQGCHYADLADAREFVAGITELDAQAKEKGVLICSGASSVPCLTASIIDKYKGEFHKLEKVEYAIATAQLTNRGLATIRAVLSYAGKPFTTLIDGKMQNVYGWMDLTWRRFWKLNLRPLGNCDIPDLELFPKRYPDLETIRFRAGLELKILHLILVSLSGLVRIKLLPSIQPLSRLLLRISFLFDSIGKDDSGFYMLLSGKDESGNDKYIQFDLVARHGDGLCIPSVPAIILAKKLANGEIDKTGATPCIDLITMDEYLDVLSEFDIEWQTTYPN